MVDVFIVGADEPFLVRLSRALAVIKKVQIVGSSRTAEEALREIPRDNPDVVLIDNKLPAMNGVECLRRLKKGPHPLSRVNVLMLTEYEDSKLVSECLKAGANGCLLKDRSSIRQLSISIKAVIEGLPVVSTEIPQKVIQFVQAPMSSLSALSKREMEVLINLSEGLMNKEIAAKLSISVATVRTHLRAITTKLRVPSRTGAVRRYLQRSG